ncbi:MAG: GerW family sporulation protein [Bacillota bacterium]
MNHEELLRVSVTQLEKFLSTKTVVGEPIVIGDVTLVPVQTVSFGYGSGGGEGGDEKQKGSGGGGGAGANMKPIAIVAVKGTDVQVYTLGKKGIVDNIAAMIPDALSKIKLGKGKKDDKDEKEAGAKEESEK